MLRGHFGEAILIRLLSLARISQVNATALSLTAAAFILSSSLVCAQSPNTGARPNFNLPAETAGIDAIAKTLIATFDQVDMLALGEAHERKIDSDLRLAIIRNPEFARKARAVVIECGSQAEQETLDAYIEGKSVPSTRLAKVWKTTRNGEGFCNSPMYLEFLAAIRQINFQLPADKRIQVFGGEPGPGEKRTTIDVLRRALQNYGKVLIIYGAAHFYLTGPADYLESSGDIGLAAKLSIEYPGRTLSVIPIGALARPGAVSDDTEPDFSKFDRAIKTPVRPVLLSLQRIPFSHLMASEFLGRTLTTCRGKEGCRSVFKGSPLTLGQMADAAVYLGR